MTDELSERARSVLARYKEVEAMPPAQRSRLLANILDAVARRVLPKVDLHHFVPVAPSATLGERFWATPLSKPLIASVFLALPALAAVAWTQREEAPSLPAKPRVARAAQELALPIALAPELPKPAVPPKPSAAPLDSATHAVKPLGNRPRDTANGATIDGELSLLKEAQAANQSGDSRRALSLLDEYALHFPAGRLADVQAVARLVALCKLGQVSLARQEAARFQAKYPKSPFIERVQKICVSKVGP